MSKNNIDFHIIGAGRGGTSLIAGLLDYHPEIEVGFERHAVSYLLGKRLYFKRKNAFLQRTNAYLAACKRDSRKHPDLLWGNKITTEQIHGLKSHNKRNPNNQIDIIDQFFNHVLAQTKIIFILRDGRACINSKVNRTGQSYQSATKWWQYSVNYYRFFQERHQNNICVRFEDLLGEPENELRKITDFLGIPYDPEMLAGTNNAKMRPEYQKKKLDPSKTKAIELREPYLSAIENDLKYCGYL